MMLRETGIKAIDLLAPVPERGRYACLAPPGTGQFVLLAELIHNGSGPAVMLLAEERVRLWDLPREFRQAGIEQRVRLMGVTRRVTRGRQREIAAAVTAPDLAWVMADQVVAGLLDELALDVPLIVIAEEGTMDGFDSQLYLDRSLVDRRIYPAVDRQRSTTRLHLTERHARLSVAVRDRLHRGASGTDPVAARLERFLAQPFHIAEPWTGVPGERVPLGETLASCEEILAC
jgi:F-type H+/Na+-transporting ATPase subunit beta